MPGLGGLWDQWWHLSVAFCCFAIGTCHILRRGAVSILARMLVPSVLYAAKLRLIAAPGHTAGSATAAADVAPSAGTASSRARRRRDHRRTGTALGRVVSFRVPSMHLVRPLADTPYRGAFPFPGGLGSAGQSFAPVFCLTAGHRKRYGPCASV